MSLQMDLDALQTRVSDVLRELPGATDLYLFGSRTCGRGDRYSDIDVEVFTADLEAAWAVWPGFLARVAPIDIAFPLQGALAGMPVEAAYTVLFRGESPYHTVDIGLRHTDDRERFVAAIPDAMPLWRQTPAGGCSAPCPCDVYVPAPDSAGYELFDELLSGIRYVKARKRDQLLTCWRYMRGRPQRWMQLLRDEKIGRPEPHRPLTTPEIKMLDVELRKSERELLARHLDWSEPGKMDRSFAWFTQENLIRLLRWVGFKGEHPPFAVADRLVAFMRDEFGLEPGYQGPFSD